MARVNAAFEILRDPAARAEYDRLRRSSLTRCEPSNPRLEYVLMPFGKHRGKRLVDVPTDYLAWLVSEVDNRPWLISVVSEELERRGFRLRQEAHT